MAKAAKKQIEAIEAEGAPSGATDHGDVPAGHADAHHHKPNRKQYLQIFLALFVLTVLEVGVAYLDKAISKTQLVTALVGLALTKAGLVALFYMHLRHESRSMRWTVAVPAAFPAIYALVLIAEGAFRAIWGT